jgi:hypothetical protein
MGGGGIALLIAANVLTAIRFDELYQRTNEIGAERRETHQASRSSQRTPTVAQTRSLHLLSR